MTEKTDFGKIFRMHRDRQVLRLAAIMTLQFGGYMAMLGFLPRVLTESGTAPAKAGITVAIWVVVLGVSNMIGPWFSDALGLRRPFVIFGALLTGITLTAMVPLPAGANVWGLIVAAVSSGIFGPLLLTMPVELSTIGVKNIGSAIGFMTCVSQAGAFLISMIMGAAVDAMGLAGAFVAMALIHFAILIPVYGLMETGSRKAEMALAR